MIDIVTDNNNHSILSGDCLTLLVPVGRSGIPGLEPGICTSPRLSIQASTVRNKRS